MVFDGVANASLNGAPHSRSAGASGGRLARGGHSSQPTTSRSSCIVSSSSATPIASAASAGLPSVETSIGAPMDVSTLGSPAEAAEAIGVALDELTMQLDREVVGCELWPPRASLPPLAPADRE